MTRIVTAVLIIAGVSLVALLPGESSGSRCRPVTTVRHVDNVIVREVIAPIAIPTLFPAAVFQYMPALQPAAPAPVSPVDIDRIVAEKVEAALREKLGQVDGPPPLTMAEPPAVFDELQQKAVNILANKCYTCHTESKAAGRAILFTKDHTGTYFQPNKSKAEILNQIVSGKMPKGQPPIVGRDLDILRQYLSTP